MRRTHMLDCVLTAALASSMLAACGSPGLAGTPALCPSPTPTGHNATARSSQTPSTCGAAESSAVSETGSGSGYVNHYEVKVTASIHFQEQSLDPSESDESTLTWATDYSNLTVSVTPDGQVRFLQAAAPAVTGRFTGRATANDPGLGSGSCSSDYALSSSSLDGSPQLTVNPFNVPQNADQLIVGELAGSKLWQPEACNMTGVITIPASAPKVAEPFTDANGNVWDVAFGNHGRIVVRLAVGRATPSVLNHFRNGSGFTIDSGQIPPPSFPGVVPCSECGGHATFTFIPIRHS